MADVVNAPTSSAGPGCAFRPLATLLAAALLAACASDDAGAPLTFERPETAVDYDVTLTGAPNEEIDDLLRQSLGVFRRRDDGAQSVAFLRRRAIDDVAVAQRILRSYGFYEADMIVDVDDSGDGRATAVLTVEPGRQFTLLAHRFLLIDDGGLPPPTLNPASFGSPVGGPALAAPIVAAEGAAADALRRRGRPYAEARGRDAVADLEAATLEVESVVAAGPYYVFGEPAFEGLERVEAEYLRTYLTWTPGEPWDQRRAAEYQTRLVETGLFNAVSALPPSTPPDGEVAPVVVRVEEGARRTVSAGVRYGTDTGVGLRGSYEHRNLFGANETIRFDALASLEEQSLETRYRVPQYLRDGQDFTAGLGLRRIESDAFDETAGTLTVGLERALTRDWTVGAGGLLEVSQTEDSDGERLFVLAGLPAFAAFDDTDDLLNPTEGVRVRVDVTPFAGVADEGDPPLFTRIDSVASTYYALDAERRYVLAGRVRLGSIPSLNPDDVPAGRRLYSGGGGSVRGYAERFIGPLDEDGEPVGGRSVAELGGEIRALVSPPFGVAAFVEGGAVSEEVVPVFDEGFQVAAGAGVRYLSPVGPLRVDVGVPLNPREEDDSFQIYISIGQAF